MIFRQHIANAPDEAKPANCSDKNFAVLSALEDFAQQRGHSMLDLAIGWLATRAWVSSVIAGATRPEQLGQNVKAGEWKLTPDEMAEVDRLTRRPE